MKFIKMGKRKVKHGHFTYSFSFPDEPLVIDSIETSGVGSAMRYVFTSKNFKAEIKWSYDTDSQLKVMFSSPKLVGFFKVGDKTVAAVEVNDQVVGWSIVISSSDWQLTLCPSRPGYSSGDILIKDKAGVVKAKVEGDGRTPFCEFGEIYGFGNGLNSAEMKTEEIAMFVACIIADRFAVPCLERSN